MSCRRSYDGPPQVVAGSTAGASGADDLDQCDQCWRGDDDDLHICGFSRGHSGECTCEFCGETFSELVEMR